MKIPIDLYGLGALIMFIIITQLIITYRAIKSAKSRLHYLHKLRNDAIHDDICTVHYQKAHDILEMLNVQIIYSSRRSFWGFILSIFSKSLYEIPTKR